MTKTNHYGMLAALATALLTVGLLVVVKPAEAAFPGTNGKIAFTSVRDGNPEIYTMNAGGGPQTRLTFNEAADTTPSW